MANEYGVEVPEHTILSRLGRGGMAAVYLARDERLGRLVAVKVIDEKWERDPQFRRRFDREAKTAAGLTHPNIVSVYNYGFTEDERPFLSMAFLDGGSLREKLRKRGTLGIEESLGIARQIASALQAAHTRNIVHRDLKPDNVLFQGETAFLSDFGIAKLIDASTELTATGANPGTVKYFSPEQALERPVDQRSDIYSLGVLLYEMLTGSMPIDGDTVATLMMRIAYSPPKPLPGQFSGLQPFMDVMMATDPADRLATCGEVIAIIQAMERNWLRYGEMDRLTDGVEITPSGVSAPAASLDDEAPTLVQPAAAQLAPTLASGDNSSGAGQRTGPTVRISDRTPTPTRSSVDALRAAKVADEVTARARQSDPVGATRMEDLAGLSDMGQSTPITSMHANAVQMPVDTAVAAVGARGSRLGVLVGGAVVIAVLLLAGYFMLGGRSTPTPPNGVVRSANQTAAGTLEAGQSALVASPAASGGSASTGANVVAGLLEGNWGVGNCDAPSTWIVKNGVLHVNWPSVGLAKERIIATTAGSITTEVVTPLAQRGRQYRYTPTATSLVVEDLTKGRRESLQKCE